MRETPRTKKLKEKCETVKATSEELQPLVEVLSLVGSNVECMIGDGTSSACVDTGELYDILSLIPKGASTMVRLKVVEFGIALVDEEGTAIVTLGFG